jgi:acyl-CoA reductase-like NAD-dependent aldehyde dehydrogenase
MVEADNPYQAAVVARDRHGDGVEIADVRPAVGRAPLTTRKTTVKQTVKKATKTAAKKRRALSPEARAKLAQNLVKARAARARNLKATAKKPTRKPAKKTVAKNATRTAKRR